MPKKIWQNYTKGRYITLVCYLLIPFSISICHPSSHFPSSPTSTLCISMDDNIIIQEKAHKIYIYDIVLNLNILKNLSFFQQNFSFLFEITKLFFSTEVITKSWY
jgi:hypothetical protein